jgi:hypothetical protein
MAAPYAAASALLPHGLQLLLLPRFKAIIEFTEYIDEFSRTIDVVGSSCAYYLSRLLTVKFRCAQQLSYVAMQLAFCTQAVTPY